MKSITELFPNASKDTVAANPHLSGSATVSPKPKQNDVQVNSIPNGGRVGHSSGFDITPITQEEYEAINHRKIQDSESEHHQTPALGAAVQGKTQGMERTRVCFIGYRCKPLDPDNFAGSVKDLLDGLRHSGLIYGDEVWRIALETRQEKVSHYTQEKTVIEIEI